jgi:hypothetical protein
MASLTEAAKAVLEGKVLEEGIPTVGSISGGVSNPNPVDPSTASTGNAKTLKPNSKASEADPKHNEAEDLGGTTPTSVASDNLGAKAAGKKDSSKSSKASVAADPSKKLTAMAEEEEFDGDVVEEEKVSLADRLKALKEAKKEKAEKEDEKDEDEKEEKEDKMEKCDEEVELSEELEDFINEGIEAGLTEEEILAAIDENFEFVTEDEDSPLETYQVDMAEHVNALLEGEDLSEEFHAKATTIFEAAVKAKLEEEVALLEQAYAETLEERIAEIQESLSSQVDDYLNYVVEQWIEENEVAVESALRSELTEDFISGLRTLFAEHYIDVPEEEVDVVEELSQTVEALESKLNEEIERNVALTGMLAESRKVELTSYVCEGLTNTQTEKLKSLAEGVEYTSDEEFVEKISTLRENYFPVAVKSDAVLDRVDDAKAPGMINEDVNLNGPMANYVKAIGRNLPK